MMSEKMLTSLLFMSKNKKYTCPYPEIFPLSALIACNAMNSPGGAAIYYSHRFHH